MDRDGEKRYLLISHLDFRKTVLLYIKKIDHKSDHSPTSHIVWKWIDIDTFDTLQLTSASVLRLRSPSRSRRQAAPFTIIGGMGERATALRCAGYF